MRKVIEINGCWDCPYRDMMFCQLMDYGQLESNFRVKGDIDDRCPLEDAAPQEVE